MFWSTQLHSRASFTFSYLSALLRGAALWANRAFIFSACLFLNMWMLDNSNLWRFKLAINHGLNDVLNPRLTKYARKAFLRDDRSHHRSFATRTTWVEIVLQTMVILTLQAAINSSEIVALTARQNQCQRRLGLNTANLNNKHSRWVNVYNDPHQSFPLKTIYKAKTTTPK